MGPQFGETVYISETTKVKSNVQVAMNENSDPVQKFFRKGDWEGQCPQLKFFQTCGIVGNESSYEAHIRAAG